ncbi:amino acid/polyamine transporter I [Ilyonectria sp. MPI-CAGE-AT-0026]|nr:amino acid/polyamine transporter I [Ilyonectria sp. MPI-CAGE-AT-0026]
MDKPFSTLSAMAIGATTTNSAVGVYLTFSTTIAYGGTMLLFYGFIGMALVGLATAVSLAELTAGCPDAGGQYVWVARLASPKHRRFLSYITALFSWAGAVCVGGSTCLISPLMIFEMVTFFNPDFQYDPWMAFLAYQAVNLSTLIPTLFQHFLPKFSKGLLMWTLALLLSVIVGLFAASDDRRSAEDFFTHFHNTSGWSNGVTVLIGLNSLNWCFSCLDSIVHLSEEIPRPQENIPRALMWSIVVGFSTGLLTIFAFMFNSTDYDTQYSSVTIIYYAFSKSKTAAVAFQSLFFISAIGAQFGIHVWQSRLAWTIAINKGIPFHSHLIKVAGSPFNTPIWALCFSAVWTSILGCLYLASTSAFNSFTATGILFQYISYVIPVVLLNIRGRSKFQHGKFWFPWLGLVANGVLCCWFVVALIFYSFPYSHPLVLSQMNYVSVVIGCILIIVLACWFSYGRKHFTFPELEEMQEGEHAGLPPRTTNEGEAVLHLGTRS